MPCKPGGWKPEAEKNVVHKSITPCHGNKHLRSRKWLVSSPKPH